MSTVATGMANNTTPSFLPGGGNSLLLGALVQRNNGVHTTLDLWNPFVLAAGPNGPGGTVTAVQLLVASPGGPPATSIGINIQGYDASGNIIYSRVV